MMWSFPMFVSFTDIQASRKSCYDGNLAHFRRLNIVKIHLMMTLVDITHNFGIFIEHQNSLFVLRHLHLQWSFCLAIVHKIALSAIDFVHYSRRWMVGFILLLWSWKSAVDGVLRLVMEEYLHVHCQKSSVFPQEIKQYSIEVMVSFDVKSLFTSVPVDLALTIIKERLQQDQNLSERTSMSVSNIMKLVDFVLTHNYFKYVVMEEILEEAAISTAIHPLKWWFHYVDNSHTCLKRDHVNEFHLNLNSINRNIQFTIELENTNGQGLLYLSSTPSQLDVVRKSKCIESCQRGGKGE